MAMGDGLGCTAEERIQFNEDTLGRSAAGYQNPGPVGTARITAALPEGKQRGLSSWRWSGL